MKKPNKKAGKPALKFIAGILFLLLNAAGFWPLVPVAFLSAQTDSTYRIRDRLRVDGAAVFKSSVSIGRWDLPGAALSVSTGATAMPAFFIKASDGSVGIGTSAPASGKLQVEGGSADNATGIYGYTNSNGGASVYGVQDNSGGKAVYGRSAGGYAGYFDGKVHVNGNIGIGTTAPASKLTLADGDIRISTTTGSRGIIFQDGTTQITASQGDSFWADQGSNNISNTNSANVGIGTTAPGAFKLNVNGNSNISGTLNTSGAVTSSAGGAAGGFQVNWADDQTLMRQYYDAQFFHRISGDATSRQLRLDATGDSTTALVVRTGQVGSLTERMRITSDGNVGVATITPRGLLHVGAGATPGLLVTNTGNVGIGITNPGSKLEIYGAVAGTSYAFGGATGEVGGDTGLFSAGDGLLELKSNGAVVLHTKRGDSESGYIGIGTTDPGSRLNIYGTLAQTWGSGLQLTRENGGDARINSSAAGMLLRDFYGGGQAFDFRNSSDASLLTLQTGGNVGIGTTAPAYKLTMTGTGAVRTEIVGTDAGSTAGIFLRSNGNAGGATIRDNNKDLEFFTSTAGQALTIRDGGNVGIGTTNPTEKLQVNSNINLYYSAAESMKIGMVGGAVTWGIQVTDTGDGGNGLLLNPTSGNVGIGTITPGYKLDVAGTMNAQEVRVNGVVLNPGTGSNWTVSGSDIYRNGGNVGIGVISPGRKLVVGSGDASMSTIQLVNTESGVASSDGGYLATDDTNIYLGNQEANGLVTLFTDNDATKGLSIKNGNVGIRTTAPSGLLDVAGAAYIRNNISGGAFAAVTLGASGTDYGHVGYGFKVTATNGNYTYAQNDFSSLIDFYLGGFKFKTAASGTAGNAIAYDERMTILQGGNVGVGITNPAGLFQVGGGSLTVLTSGSVGIGTTSPAYPLEIWNGNTSSIKLTRFIANTLPVAHENVKSRGATVGAYAKVAAGDTLASFRASGVADDNSTIARAARYDVSVPAGGVPGGGTTVAGDHLWYTTNIAGTEAERMRLTSEGNVGIGTAGPLQPLQVGNLNASSVASDGQMVLARSGASGGNRAFKIGLDGNYSLSIGDYGNSVSNPYTPYITVGYAGGAYSGNVGIGTSTPGAPLHIRKDTDGTQTLLRLANISGGAASTNEAIEQIFALGDGAADFGGPRFTAGKEGDYTSAANRDAYLSLSSFQNDSALEVMRLTSAGNVGIGTTGPKELMHLFKSGVGSGDNQLLKLHYDMNSGGGTYIGFTQTSSVNAYAKALIGYQSVGGGYGGNGNLIFAVDPDVTDTAVTAGDAKMVIQGNGNVGIGTTGPNAKLEISNSASYEALRLTGSGVGNFVTMKFLGGAASDYAAMLGSYYGDLRVNVGAVASPVAAMFIAGTTGGGVTAGNVGIGATAPAYKLDVAGTMNAQEVRVNGVVLNPGTGSNWTVSGSDIYRNSGNVGIGTTGPDAKLSVVNTSGAPLSTRATVSAMFLGLGSVGAGGSIGFDYDGVSHLNYPVGIGYSISLNSSYTKGALVFGTRDATTDTAPTERMRIQADGNVGIGTTSPEGTLNVAYAGGKSVFGNTSGGNNIVWVRSSGGSAGLWAGGNMGMLSTGDIQFIPNQTYGAENYTPAMVVKTTGNVGIGTANPGVQDDEGDDLVLNSSLATGNGMSIVSPVTGRGNLMFADGPEGSNAAYRGAISYDHGTGFGGAADTMYFRTAGALQMAINPSGNVGIGTIVPTVKLNIGDYGFAGGGDYPGVNAVNTVSINNANPTTNTYNGYQLMLTETGALGANKGGAIGFSAIYNDTGGPVATVAGIKGLRDVATADVYSGYLSFLTRNTAGTIAEKMRIDKDGNVGIGMTTPVGQLELSRYVDFSLLGGITSSALHIGAANTTNNMAQISFGLAGGVANSVPAALGFVMTNTAAATAGALFFATRDATTDSAPTERMRITSAGNVGIGTTGPGFPLQLGSYKGFSVYLDQGADATPRYYALGTYTQNNGELKVSGVLAGHTQAQGRANVNVAFAARDGMTALGSASGSFGSSDIVLYCSGTCGAPGDIYTVYLKTGIYSLVNIDVSAVSGGAVTYNGSYITSTPSGTLAYTLSSDAGGVLRSLTNGNVGIGVTAPAEKLEVNGLIALTAASQRLIYLNQNNTGTGYLGLQAGGWSAGYGGGLKLYGNSDATHPGDVAVGLSNNSSAKFRVNTSGVDTGTDLFTVLQTGNVGVGTAGPNTLLHLFKAQDSTNARDYFRLENNGYSNAYMGIKGYDFYINNAPNTDGGLVYNIATGNVGIGTTGPVSKLHLVDNTAGSMAIFEQTNANGYGVVIRAGGTAAGRYGLVIRNAADNVDYFQVLSETGKEGQTYIKGDVGIGTTGPGQKLDVNGNIRARGDFGSYSTSFTNWTNGSTQNLFYWGTYGAPVSLLLTVVVRQDGAGNLSMYQYSITGFGGGGAAAITTNSSSVYGAGCPISIAAAVNNPTGGSQRISITNISGVTATSVQVYYQFLTGYNTCTFDI